MTRREILGLFGAAGLLPALPGLAQEAGRTYRLGILHNQGRQAPQFPPFFDELRQHGFVENENLIVDGRGYAARTEQFPVLAAELARVRVDAILCGGPAAARAALGATRTVPLLVLANDMVAAGLVSSLARPGGNLTGISFLATELDGKRQDILLEVVSGARRIAALADPNTTAPPQARTLQDAARARGLELSVHMVERPERIVAAIDEAKRGGAAGLNVLGSPILYARRLDIYERTTELRLPAIYQWPESAEEGGLLGYGPRITLLFRQLARQLVKVLRGARPGDLPIEQPTKFELVVNLKTAKVIGLTVPQSVLLAADGVIQ